MIRENIKGIVMVTEKKDDFDWNAAVLKIIEEARQKAILYYNNIIMKHYLQIIVNMKKINYQIIFNFFKNI